MSQALNEAALAEVRFCESVLAKGGASVVSETLRGVVSPQGWVKYPDGEVYDPTSGAQWFYHSHTPSNAEGEHGHFHCFLRPDGADGPAHHLIALGVSAIGQLQRLFTVNHWVVEDDWLPASETIALLTRFDVHMPHPNYLVNRWITGVIAAYDATINDLIHARDDRILAWGDDPVATRADRALEVTSEFQVPTA